VNGEEREKAMSKEREGKLNKRTDQYIREDNRDAEALSEERKRIQQCKTHSKIYHPAL